MISESPQVKNPATKPKARWAAVAVVLISGAEGLRTYAYKDPVGIPTICFGETLGVAIVQHQSAEACKAMLEVRLEEFNAGLEHCIHVPLGDNRRAALLSFSYNVGTGAFCRSRLAKRLNAGDPHACDELMKWTRAGGIELPGLLRRRQEERALCEKDF